MEDDLKILNVEYLSNRSTDLTQIWNLSLGDRTKVWKFFKWRRFLMEDDLKILDLEYFSNHWTDLTKNGNLSLGDQTKVYKCPPINFGKVFQDQCVQCSKLSHYLISFCPKKFWFRRICYFYCKSLTYIYFSGYIFSWGMMSNTLLKRCLCFV